MTPGELVPFNPLAKTNLAESIVGQLLMRPPICMTDLTRFRGAGIYAIYYNGNFHAYQPLVEMNDQGPSVPPIYVGKAVPKGARKGGDLEASPGNVLYNRLGQHVNSIQEATNLAVNEFTCRYLTLDDIWIPLAEALLIAKFSPLWNTLVDGFGNHDPGKGRHKGVRSRWDTLHPGRKWAKPLLDRKETTDIIISDVRRFFAS